MATAAKKTTTKPGTAVAVKKANAGAIVSIQEELKRKAAEMADRTEPAGGNTIRVTQSKTMKLPDGTEVEEMDLVVVEFTSTQAWYEGVKFDPKNPRPPGCAAIGDNPKQLIPFKDAPNLQSDKCSSCPQFQWGSDGNGKACKSGRKLAVLPPDGDADTPLWLLNVSPTAIKGFDGFVNAVARMGTFPVAMVVRVSFNAASEHAQLVFSDPQPNPNLEAHYARTEEAKQLLATPTDFSQYTPPAGAKPRAATRAASKR